MCSKQWTDELKNVKNSSRHRLTGRPPIIVQGGLNFLSSAYDQLSKVIYDLVIYDLLKCDVLNFESENNKIW